MGAQGADVAAVIAALPSPLPDDRRFVVAIGGPPAAGKTTLAAAVAAELGESAAVLGLDAFHYDDAVLNARGTRARKGAPHTFDVDGYRACLSRLRREAARTVAIPEFDRTLELTRNAAKLVLPTHRIVITEGNYLLLAIEPWASLSDLFDLTVMLDIDDEIVHQRILERWTNHGLEPSAALERAKSNDLPNAELVRGGSKPANLTLAVVGS